MGINNKKSHSFLELGHGLNACFQGNVRIACAVSLRICVKVLEY